MTDRENSVGRLHDPTLRELTAEMDGLREVLEAKLEAIKELMKERHDLYNERDQTRSKMVETAFANSEKSNQKTEQAQKDYNTQHNDLINKMDKQNSATIPRIESESRFRQMEEKIALLRESVTPGLGPRVTTIEMALSSSEGKGQGIEKVWGWIVAAAGSGGVLAWLASHFTR